MLLARCSPQRIEEAADAVNWGGNQRPASMAGLASAVLFVVRCQHGAPCRSRGIANRDAIFHALVAANPTRSVVMTQLSASQVLSSKS